MHPQPAAAPGGSAGKAGVSSPTQADRIPRWVHALWIPLLLVILLVAMSHVLGSGALHRR
jgi:hypothetical protein